MKIWWFWRFTMEGFLLFGFTFWFCSSGGYVYNFRGRYVRHYQKRERSMYRNPYFLPPAERKLQYDQFFNVLKDKLFIEKDLNRKSIAV